MMYQAAIFSQDLDRVISLFSDVIRRPAIDELEVEEQRATALYELQEIWSKPEMFLPEVLHTVAYQGNTLGNPLLCPPENLEKMTSQLLRSYMQTWYRPERMVIATCGAEHDQVVDLAEKYFGDIPARSEPLDSVLSHHQTMKRQAEQAMVGGLSAPASVQELATQPAFYTGGTKLIEGDGSSPFTHVYIAFEGLSIDDPDIYALATLQILLGGGGSFSAGGPGKGMYSRLFTNVLNQHYWVESCQSFNHCYRDSGLFGISGSCMPNAVNHLVDVICRELDLVARDDMGNRSVNDIELNRAKNQLKSSLLMNLESRMVQLEDLGRQVQVHGKKTGIDEMLARIDKVDVKELRRVAERIVRGGASIKTGGSGQPTLVVNGDLRQLKDIHKILRKYNLGKN
ncbi:Mitochondrial-processing peptidase subunit alpha [Apophysomyces ossiformis]|uniref:Alpha-MPP n=1 Tax=Apophysomyces ossiformis TaxID=679940 RepID=A0A8H7ET25_9FUNG|nr:Mitochondrial-processing peptidase subunit alpha [Apophysomyces ossiformis]